jgi:hypothetical protein
MRIRIVEATERQARALERIAEVCEQVYEDGAGAIRIINLAGDE